MRLEEVTDSFIQKGIFDGTVILAGNREKDFFLFTRGLADRIAGTPFTEKTVIDVSSVSKPLGTATAAVICMEKGLLNPEEDFRTYVMDYQGELPFKVNLTALATHTSGLLQEYPLDCTAEVMLNAMKHCRAIHAPFTEYKYACLNYYILGWAVENASGKKLDIFAKECIFEPAGMSDTSWGFPLRHTFPRLAKTVRHLDNPSTMIFDRWARVLYPRICGNAGIFTSAEDLAKFARVMLNHGAPLLHTEYAELLYKTLTAPGLSPRTFGWNKDPKFIPQGLSPDTIYHTGSSGQSFWIDPVNGRFLIILTNLFGEHDAGICARFEMAQNVMQSLKWNV